MRNLGILGILILDFLPNNVPANSLGICYEHAETVTERPAANKAVNRFGGQVRRQFSR